MDNRTVALIASLDTKLEETLYAAQLIRDCGCGVLLVDVSTGKEVESAADIKPTQLLAMAGTDWDALHRMNRSDGIRVMSQALAACLPDLQKKGRIHAALSIGGGQNAHIAAAGMQALPFGFPKIIASAIANGSRRMGQFVGSSDIFVLPTVADIAGLNHITRKVIENACLAVVGMLIGTKDADSSGGKVKVAATMLGITTGSVGGILARLPGNRYEKTCFHANGVGGPSMEALVTEGYFDAVLDLTLHELTGELFGGYCSGASGRLEKELRSGVPAVVLPGAVEVLDFYVESDGSGAPADLEKRQYTWHNENVLHTRLLREESIRLANVLAGRLNSAAGPVHVILPETGLSEVSMPGMPLYNPEEDAVFIETLRRGLRPDVPRTVVHAGVAEQETADAVIAAMEGLMKRSQP